MTTDLSEILNRVAAGELTPEQAQGLIAAAAEADSATTGPPTPHVAPPVPVARLAIRASAVRTIVIADPTVDTAVAEGPHRVSHSGDTLTIHSDLSSGEYQTEAPRSAFMNWLASVNKAGTTLRVRVNPSLPLEVLVVAGSLELSGLRAPASVGVEAGSAKLFDGVGPLALSVASGSADVDWQFHGISTVSADLGSARVSIQPGSDVTITGEATLGAATVRATDGTVTKAKPGRGGGTTTLTDPMVVGDGTGSLKMSSRLGSLVVSVL